MPSSAGFPRFDAADIDVVADLARRSVPDSPSPAELAESLFSEDQPAVVRGDPQVGFVASARTGDAGYVRVMGVVPAVRRRGHGVALLRAAEEDLRAGGATSVQVGADPPYYLYPGVETTATAMLCLLERERYQRADANFNMAVDLDALPPDPGGHEPATQAERAEVTEWMERHWPNWTPEALRALDHSSLVIGRDTDGITAICAYDVNRAGFLGPVAVRGDLWGKGAGRPVLIGALHRIRASGRRRVEVAWVGPIRPYAGVGATISRVFFVYRKSLA
ncbi:MAG TPA: GNAT family N-acetyltransferase [Acidimicrobiales bacterium]|nr:GNAT family N-acetyltransferase [Acidimicrobiales bacterium]